MVGQSEVPASTNYSFFFPVFFCFFPPGLSPSPPLPLGCVLEKECQQGVLLRTPSITNCFCVTVFLLNHMAQCEVQKALLKGCLHLLKLWFKGERERKHNSPVRVFKNDSGGIAQLWQHNRGNYTTPTIYQKKVVGKMFSTTK